MGDDKQPVPNSMESTADATTAAVSKEVTATATTTKPNNAGNETPSGSGSRSGNASGTDSAPDFERCHTGGQEQQQQQQHRKKLKMKNIATTTMTDMDQKMKNTTTTIIEMDQKMKNNTTTIIDMDHKMIDSIKMDQEMEIDTSSSHTTRDPGKTDAGNTEIAPVEKRDKSPSQKPNDIKPNEETPDAVKLDETCPKLIENDKQSLTEAQSKLSTETNSTPIENEKETRTVNTYPQIQVRPLSELLKQEIIAVTQEELQVDTVDAVPPVNTSPQRPVTQIRRHTVARAGKIQDNGESIINDRLANMDKESLKYIINNSDTIYNEHLKSQARRRLRDEIRRQLKEIEFEQPKDKPTKDLVEDEIVDAIKLPQLLLKEIEKCFGIEISVPKIEKENESSAESTDKCSTEVVESEEVTIESDQSMQESVECKTEEPSVEKELSSSEVQSEEMAKESSTDLMTRLKIAEEFKALASKRFIPPSPKKPNSSQQKTSPQPKSNASKKQTQVITEQESQRETSTYAWPIKMEVKTEGGGSPGITCIVLSSSEDEDEDENEEDVQYIPQSADKELVNENNVTSDLSNSSSDDYQEKLQRDADHVISTFETLILPKLKDSLADQYRSKHRINPKSQLHFISCVVTSNEHNPRSFTKIQVAKIQQNLKEADNRMSLDFLSREIDNVVSEKQKEEKQTESNELITTSLTKSAELASEAQHQRSCSIDVEATESSVATAGRASMPPTPPRNDTPTNVANPTRSIHALPLGSLLGLTPGNYPLQCGLEPNESMLQVGDSVVQNLLEIDRRLLENQNRRGFLEEMIIKFQKEKSDLEMVSLELQSRKFLLLNSVISRTTTAINATPLSAVTPINSPPPMLPTVENPITSAASIPAVEKPKKRQRRVIVKRVKILAKRKARGKCSNPLQSNVVPGEPLEESTEASMPEPSAEQLHIERKLLELQSIDTDDNNKRAADSTLAASPKRQRLTRSATLSDTQQPLAVIPPLSPPPPPPEAFATMTYELPRILQKSSPSSPPAEVLANPNSNLKHYNYDYIPSGPLHQVTSPITQIRIYKEHIIAASENGDVYVFNVANHKLERQIIKHSEAITNMFLCEQESYLFTTSLDGFLKKSSLENLERVMQTVYLKEPLQSIDIAWGVAFIGSRWGNIFTYNIATNKVMDMPLLSTGQSIIAVKATKEGARRIIMLGCKGNFVFLHDAASGLLLRRLSIPEGLNVYSLLLIDGHVFCGTQKNEVYKFEFASGNMCNTLSCGNGAVAMAVYQDKYLLIGCYDGFIYVLNKETGMRLGRFNGPGRLVLALAIVGDKVVTSSKDNSLEILQIPSELLNLGQSA
ncbi:hypothetical protein ACLKA7_008432 [Drosophila subpalustris]